MAFGLDIYHFLNIEYFGKINSDIFDIMPSLSEWIFMGANVASYVMFPERRSEVLISTGLGLMPRITDTICSLINRRFGVSDKTVGLICYTSSLANITSMYRVSSICSELSIFHANQGQKVLGFCNSFVSNTHYINASAILIKVIAETACLICVGVLYPIFKAHIRPLRNLVSDLNNNELLIESLQNANQALRDGMPFTITYNGVVIYSRPTIRDTLSESDLNQIAPLRCPGFHNDTRPLDHRSEYTTPDSCTICAEDYSESQLTRTLPCGHSFHAYCVDDWLLRRSATCPMCRAVVKSEQT